MGSEDGLGDGEAQGKEFGSLSDLTEQRYLPVLAHCPHSDCYVKEKHMSILSPCIWGASDTAV